MSSKEDQRLSALGGAVESALETLVVDRFSSRCLAQGCHYALFPGGKRIRPLFALAICEDLGVLPAESHIKAAIALELLHCASLVHDDLPCLDNDDVRRGKPSLHRAFDQATALLVGDALVPLAFEVIHHTSFTDETKALMGQRLAIAYRLLSDGQALEREGVDGKSKQEAIDKLKTGALFQASAELGALMAGGEQILCQYSDLGMKFGLWFQAVDDMHDFDKSSYDLSVKSDIEARAESRRSAFETHLEACRGRFERTRKLILRALSC